MLTLNDYQLPEVVEEMNWVSTLPVGVELKPDHELDKLLADLSPDTPWADRQMAARKLGDTRSPESLAGLLDALSSDPFWMVRCTMIQALERIGDPAAIPTLQVVAETDGFQAVRSYALKAIERLSHQG